MDWTQKLAAALLRPRGFDWEATKRLAEFQRMADGAPVGAVGAPGGLAQYQPAQDAPWETEDALAALSFAPVFGDVAGLAGDAAMYATDPSTRTPGNYAMTAAGALPFVPSAKAAMLAKALASVPAFSAITAWHGSPHVFDKFDPSKIGTGEGAQAYGHGLYFAESPEVAKSYQMDGALYSVDIPDEHIARMLDWDAPLSEQSPVVMEALNKGARRWLIEDGTGSGGGWTPWKSAGASEALRQAGIPGIKYFDGISRGAGQGTRNFVVFPGEENALTILTRNGQPLK